MVKIFIEHSIAIKTKKLCFSEVAASMLAHMKVFTSQDARSNYALCHHYNVGKHIKFVCVCCLLGLNIPNMQFFLPPDWRKKLTTSWYNTSIVGTSFVMMATKNLHDILCQTCSFQESIGPQCQTTIKFHNEIQEARNYFEILIFIITCREKKD